MTFHHHGLPFDDPPIKVWVAHGYRCAIFWGGLCFCGYVQLPPGHVWRELADAVNRVAEEDHRPLIGFDMIDIDAPGGLTWGPDEHGWVGFDTAHAYDLWEDEEIRTWLEPVDREAWLKYSEVALVMREQLHMAWPPQAHFPDSHRWTMAELVAATEHAAEQLAEAASKLAGGRRLAEEMGPVSDEERERIRSQWPEMP